MADSTSTLVVGMLLMESGLCICPIVQYVGVSSQRKRMDMREGKTLLEISRALSQKHHEFLIIILQHIYTKISTIPSIARISKIKANREAKSCPRKQARTFHDKVR